MLHLESNFARNRQGVDLSATATANVRTYLHKSFLQNSEEAPRSSSNGHIEPNVEDRNRSKRLIYLPHPRCSIAAPVNFALKKKN